ncbi:MAG: HNH endonuclease [Bdellovibrionaceae bacterium]|nr:HNH endonuclease [Pseudobdellovibrionaceae bacterium]
MPYNVKESTTLNLKHLKDDELLTQTLNLVQKERHLLTQVLHHLKEVERRRLFSDLGYQSLFEYAVKELKYSEGQAGRRIQAMRLLKELPELEKKIESGALSLTNISQAQAYFREVKKSTKSTKSIEYAKSATTKTESNKILKATDKVKILENLENKSTREGQKILLQMLPEIVLPKEKERILSDNHTEIKFVVNQELKNRLTELRSLLGAKGATMNMAELIEYMTKTSIEVIKIKKFGKKRVLNEPSLENVGRAIETQKLLEAQIHIEEEHNVSLFEFQNKASKTESDLPCGARTNIKNIKYNLQLKRKLPYSKQAKSKLQQDQIAPELQCSMNTTAKNNNSFKNIYEDGLDKKQIALELQCSMNSTTKNNKSLPFRNEKWLNSKRLATELVCNKKSKTINNHLSLDVIPEHRFSELVSKPKATENPTEKPINISTNKSTSSRYISQLLKYQVWQRDQGKCQICSGQSFLNIDHIQPLAMGGKSKLENLRLLCFNCNQRQAINSLGIKRMESYL